MSLIKVNYEWMITNNYRSQT